MVDNQANINKIYLKTSPKTPPPRVKAWTITFLLESSNDKIFQSRDLLNFNHQNKLPIKAFKQVFHIIYRKNNFQINMRIFTR